MTKPIFVQFTTDRDALFEHPVVRVQYRQEDGQEQTRSSRSSLIDVIVHDPLTSRDKLYLMAFAIQEILKIQPRQVMKNSLRYLTGMAEIFVVLSVPLTFFIARDV